MDPIQYVQPPQNSFAQGYQDISGIMRNQLASMAMAQDVQRQESAMRQQEAQQQVMQDLMRKQMEGSVTASDYEAATTAIPGMREHFKQAWEMRSDEEKKSSLNEMTQVYSALSSNRADLAKQILQERLDALKNSGSPADKIQAIETMLKNIDASPDFVRLTTGMKLGAIGAKEAFSALEEKRKEELQPGELKKQEGEIKQQAAQLGLTKAQTNEAAIRARNLSLEGKKTVLELEAMKTGGVTNPKDKIDAEQKLRKEYNDQTANFQQVRESYARIANSDKNAAGDLALIFNYMKMLDPGSVVREGEFATAQNAAGIDTRTMNIYNRLVSGERLSADQRKQFTGQAEKLYKAAQSREGEVRKGMTGIVKRYGLDENNIFYQGNIEPKSPSPVDSVDRVSQIPGQGGIPHDIAALVGKYARR